MNNFEKAIKAASELSSHEGAEFRVINHHPEFLNGSLYIVEFNDSNGESKCNYVYIEGEKINVCKNPALLNELVARKSQVSGIIAIMESIGGIAGIIGLVITGTIIWLLVKNPSAQIPQVLSAALTTILGFYFGSKTNK